jgi:hypothetical protein
MGEIKDWCIKERGKVLPSVFAAAYGFQRGHSHGPLLDVNTYYISHALEATLGLSGGYLDSKSKGEKFYDNLKEASFSAFLVPLSDLGGYVAGFLSKYFDK